MSIRIRLVLLAAISMLCMMAASWLWVDRIQRDTRVAQQQARQNHWARECSALVHHLQRERGYSAGGLASGTHDAELLARLRADTDAALATLTRNPLATQIRMGRTGLSDSPWLLTDARGLVDGRSENWRSVRDQYTVLVNRLLNAMQLEPIGEAGGDHATDRRQLTALTALALARESLGLLRATVNAFRLHPERMGNVDRAFIASHYTLYKHQLAQFRENGGETMSAMLDVVQDSDIHGWVFSTLDRIIAQAPPGGAELARDWWDRITAVIDGEKAIEERTFDALVQRTTAAIDVQHRYVAATAIAAGAMTIALAVFVWLTITRMIGDLRTLSTTLDEVVGHENFTLRLKPTGAPNEINGTFDLFNRLLTYTDGLLREKSKLASFDALTGLMNRRSLLNYAEREVGRANRHARRLSLVFIDIDHFKDVNDLLGHSAGDAALRGFADVLKSRKRGTDMLARWGGEEFLLLLPETGLEGAVRCAEAIREAVEATHFPKAGELTCSLGVAEWRKGESFDALCTRADGALYRAKGIGRNRVCIEDAAA